MSEMTITIHLSSTSARPGQVTVLTTAAVPRPGQRLSDAEALALDLINTCHRRAATVRYWQGHDAALALVRELIDPEGFGHAVTPEVRQRAAAVLARAHTLRPEAPQEGLQP